MDHGSRRLIGASWSEEHLFKPRSMNRGMETGNEDKDKENKGSDRGGNGYWEDKERAGEHTGRRMKWGRETAMQKKKIRNWGTKKK